MVKNALSVSANAKINLHLEVLAKRDDGFHNIVSVFHPVSLSDELLITRLPRVRECRVSSPLLNLPKSNTLTMAYEEFANISGINDGIDVKIIKNIPSGAGLGGGSSDAASLLLALNDMFRTNLSVACLKEIALKIGSDVPFFIENKPAIVLGRGEIIKPVSVNSGYFGLLVYPEVKSSTAVAYSLFNEKLPERSSFEPEGFCNLDCCNWPFFNSFEDVLFEKYPQIEKVKSVILSSGADFALMSGSGASVFGLFNDENKARVAYFDVLKQYKSTFLFFLLAF